MDIVTAQIGCDAHKEELFFQVPGKKVLRILNQEELLQKFIPQLPRPCVVHIEASGGYERLAKKLLSKAGIEVRVHNPLRARRLFQALGNKAKTDAIDAKALSESGQLLPPQLQKSQVRQALADISRAIGTLKKDLQDYRKRVNAPELDSVAKDIYKSIIKNLVVQVKKAEAEYLRRIKESDLYEEYKLMMGIPCIGKVTAGICLAELPENAKTQTSQQISSYAGLAPIDDSSGKRKGAAHLRKGNTKLKGAFYMPALTAISKHDWAKDLYARQKALGKNHQQAIVPIMRRLLVRIHAVISRATAWEATSPLPIFTSEAKNNLT